MAKLEKTEHQSLGSCYFYMAQQLEIDFFVLIVFNTIIHFVPAVWALDSGSGSRGQRTRNNANILAK